MAFLLRRDDYIIEPAGRSTAALYSPHVRYRRVTWGAVPRLDFLANTTANPLDSRAPGGDERT